MNRRLATLTLTALACTMVASAQTSSTSGAVRGQIKDKGGKSVAGASVLLRNRETGFTRTAVSDVQGEYHIGLLPVGNYELTVTASGMRALKDTSVQVSLGQNTVANFSLDKAEASATVEIVASSQTLDTTQVNNVTAVDSKMVESIPLNGRNFTDLVNLTPMSAPNDDGTRVSVGGARGIQNNLTIDGASYQSNFFGEQRGSTRIPFTFGADTIKELQIITNAYDAQYGNAAGAVINAVSKTGTNEFSGSVLYQIRPSSMVSKIRPVPYDRLGTVNTQTALTREFKQDMMNFVFGGPIIKDKLHFFIGVETLHYTENMTPSFATASTGFNSDTYFQTFLPTFGKLVVGNDGHTLASESGSPYTSDQRNTTYFGRLDWTINESHRATLRVNAQDLKWLNGTTSLQSTFAPTTGVSNQGTEKDSGLSWVLELNSSFGTNVVNEARLQRAIERRPRYANTTATPEVQVSSGFTWGQTNFLPNGLDEKTWQFIDNLTWNEGDWTLKGGIDYQKFDFVNSFYRYQNGAYAFSNYQTANLWAVGGFTTANSTPGNANFVGRLQYTGSYSDYDGTISYGSKLIASYVQAQYAGLLDRRLNLSLGLRVTQEDQPANPRPNASFQGLDQANSTTAKDPRFGFTYDLDGKGTTLLKGGYGHFSSPNPSLTVSNTMNSNGNTTSTFVITSSGAAAPLLAAFNSGLLSYGTRVTNAGTVLTALPQDVLRNPGSYGLASAFSASKTGQVWDPNNRLAVAKRMSLGLEHQYANGLKLGIMGVYTMLENLQYFVNINAWQANADGTFNANGWYQNGFQTQVNRFTTTGTNGRPNKAIVRGHLLDLTGFGNVALSKNDGEGRYQALALTASKFSDSGYGFQTALTFAQDKDNNSNERDTFGTTSAIATPANPMDSYGYSDNDRRIRFTFAGYFPVIWGIRGSVNYSYSSGRPYSANYSNDTNGDTFTNDFALDKGYARNAFRQLSMRTLDARFSRDFEITKRFRVETFADIFNVFNWANQRTTSTTYASSPTGTPFSDFGYTNVPDRKTREIQFGVRAKF
ncbi:cell envelope biogenesis protein OmpA [Geothrix limicola]|uniref:Cell envelope biogenesis protein OmpA n=1 Tax=Geothrix limicola TaxID=2927978 RepID=A0ABQ5QB31_9BACT|nr:TonB-dependent receptor [Geothrix limicola]GLH71671.1 cell envelope biogenesis protein OmpA [Geothrix limicola]